MHAACRRGEPTCGSQWHLQYDLELASRHVPAGCQDHLPAGLGWSARRDIHTCARTYTSYFSRLSSPGMSTARETHSGGITRFCTRRKNFLSSTRLIPPRTAHPRRALCTVCAPCARQTCRSARPESELTYDASSGSFKVHLFANGEEVHLE